MQEKETANHDEFTELSGVHAEGRIVALDPGTKRIGVAVCDELHITARPLEVIILSSWKKLLAQVKTIIDEFDAKALVIGLPLRTDGGESEMSGIARDMARKFELSLDVPVFLQDERVTSYDAKSRLWAQGKTIKGSRRLVDSEAAAIILGDFLDRLRQSTRG